MDSLDQRPSNSLDRARLDAIVAPIAQAHGAEIVDIELKSEQGGWVLRIYVEKLGSRESHASTEQAAIDLSLCSNIARELSPALDVADLIPHRYNLEISSPGVERPLRRIEDFVRFCGKKAKLRLKTAIKGQKVLVGILEAVAGDRITLADGNQSYDIPHDTIDSARLVFEFGPRPKPGKQKKK